MLGCSAAQLPEAMGKPGSFVARTTSSARAFRICTSTLCREAKDGLRGFFWPRSKYASEAEMKKVAAKVASG